tara:strand:+ start:114 stop:860 length:747 start_codon:yes stop_codon:yes gene_type:complete
MTGKKIKIALCLSGEPRSSMASFPYIYETFLKDNNIFETDVYVHSWKNFRALDLYNSTKLQIDFSNLNKEYLNFFNNLEINDSTKDYLKIINDKGYTLNSNIFKNTFSMYSSINRCFNLFQNKNYDIIIRCRLDIIFYQPLLINHILFDILNQKYDLFIPHIYNDIIGTQEVDDQLAIGNPKSMLYYGDLLYNLGNLVETTQSINSHKLLFEYLNQSDYKINLSYINHDIIRQSNIIKTKPYHNFLDE